MAVASLHYHTAECENECLCLIMKGNTGHGLCLCIFVFLMPASDALGILGESLGRLKLLLVI